MDDDRIVAAAGAALVEGVGTILKTSAAVALVVTTASAAALTVSAAVLAIAQAADALKANDPAGLRGARDALQAMTPQLRATVEALKNVQPPR